MKMSLQKKKFRENVKGHVLNIFALWSFKINRKKSFKINFFSNKLNLEYFSKNSIFFLFKCVFHIKNHDWIRWIALRMNTRQKNNKVNSIKSQWSSPMKVHFVQSVTSNNIWNECLNGIIIIIIHVHFICIVFLCIWWIKNEKKELDNKKINY